VNVYLREDQLIGEVNGWLAREFAPHRLHKTIADLAAAQLAEPAARPDGHEETALKIAGYRAALAAGASPATVAAWIADTEAEKASYMAARRPNGAKRRRMSETEIKAIVGRLADLARVLADADPNDKSEIFRQLGLRLTYHPGRGLVKAQVMPAECGFFESVRGGLHQKAHGCSWRSSRWSTGVRNEHGRSGHPVVNRAGRAWRCRCRGGGVLRACLRSGAGAW
jgi:hypothetical protein